MIFAPLLAGDLIVSLVLLKSILELSSRAMWYALSISLNLPLFL